MTELKNGINITWKQHLLVWTSYWVLVSGSAALYDLDFFPVFMGFLTKMPLTMLAAYLIFYWVLPQFWNKSSWPLAVLMVFGLDLGFVLINRIITWQFVYPWLFHGEYTFTFWNWYRISQLMVYMLMAQAFFGAYKYYFDLTETLKKERELRKQKQEAELAFLRAQVHPHFLFNSLNALYNEILQKKESAGSTLLRLTNLYRFILEECTQESIALGKELNLIEDFVDLEKLRYGTRLEIQFLKSSNLDLNAMIPPMILFSFIENSFKHGISDQQGESLVKINISDKEGVLVFEVSNPVSGNDDNLNGFRSGIGLENTKKQLELLFGGKHTLEQKIEQGQFHTLLKMPLS